MDSNPKVLKRMFGNAAVMSLYTTVHFFALARIETNALGYLVWDALVVGFWLYVSHSFINRLKRWGVKANWSLDKVNALVTGTQPIFACGVLTIIILLKSGESAWLVSVISLRGGWWLNKFLKAY